MMLKAVFFIGAIVLNFSCTHNSQNSDNSKMPAVKASDESFEDSIPMDLWSPDKRFSNALYYFFLGEFSQNERNIDKSYEYFQTAYNLDPNSFLAYKMILAGVYQNPEESMVLAKKMTLLYPEDAHIQSLYGQILLGQGFYEKAEKRLKLSSDLDPTLKQTYLNLIAIYQVQNRAEEAIKTCDRLLKYHPSYVEAYLLKTKLYVKLNKNKKALESIEKAYEFNDSDAQTLLLYAYTLELNGKTKKSVSIYEKLIEVVPLNVAITNNMVALYKDLGDLESSLALLRKLDEKLDGKNRAIKLQIVFIYWDMKEYGKCISILEKMINEDGSDERERYILGLSYEKLGKYKSAIYQYESINPISKFYYDGVYRTISINYSLGRKEQAFEKLDDILGEQDFENKDSFYKLASSLYDNEKKIDKAISVLEKARKEYPNDINLLFLLGIQYEKNKEIDKCISTMRKIIKIDPSYSAAYNYIGYLYAEKSKNLDEAEQLVKEALSIKPDDGYYLDTLGWILYKKKDYQNALNILKRANKQAPREAVIMEHIADTYVKLGSLSMAEQYYSKALKASINEVDKRRVLEKYKKVSGSKS